VINDYVTSTSNSFEPDKLLSKSMNFFCSSFIIPNNRTVSYYNTLMPVADSLARLANPDLARAGKRTSLAIIRSIFQTGTADKIKVCLDLRVSNHVINFMQDKDRDVRNECLLIFYEISKGLQDDDFEILGSNTSSSKLDLSKGAHQTKSAFDQHKAFSLSVIGGGGKDDKDKSEQKNVDTMSKYISRSAALTQKEDTDRYISLAYDLPNLHFLANKRFFKEMAKCFENPLFISPIIKLLKSPTEVYQNK
jgi:hypothetical protein